jgi:hypothetical protein
VDLNYAAVLVVSEYEMAPVHTEVNVTAALQPAWQRLRQPDSGLLLEDAPLRIDVEGAFLWVEVGSNKRGSTVATGVILQKLAALTDPRMRGRLSPDVASVILQKLATLTDSRTGEPVFIRLARRGDAGPWAAAWPYPGDVLAQAAPGYVLSAKPDIRAVFSEAPIYGQAVFDARLQAMQGTFIAAGRGVSAGGDRDIVRLPDIASMLATFLGMPSLTDDH